MASRVPASKFSSLWPRVPTAPKSERIPANGRGKLGHDSLTQPMRNAAMMSLNPKTIGWIIFAVLFVIAFSQAVSG
jgi:hypothetical protein